MNSERKTKSYKTFADLLISYSHKWDIPKEFNNLPEIPEPFRHLPVSIKTCKNNSPIGFGDALRQFQIDEDFLLVVGFWEQNGIYKNFVSVEAVKIFSNEWKNLFSPLSFEDLQILDSVIKNKTVHYSEIRKMAKKMKAAFPPTKIVLNPKIDSKVQRRLQCSLPFKTFWQDFAKKEPYKNLDCSLFGEKVPNPFVSGQRTFRQKLKPD